MTQPMTEQLCQTFSQLEERCFYQFCLAYSRQLTPKISEIFRTVLLQLANDTCGTSARLAAYTLQQELYWHPLPSPEQAFQQALNEYQAAVCTALGITSPKTLCCAVPDTLPGADLPVKLDLSDLIRSHILRYTHVNQAARDFHRIGKLGFNILANLFSALFGDLINGGDNDYTGDPLEIAEQANAFQTSLDEGFHELHCAVSSRFDRDFAPKYYACLFCYYDDLNMTDSIAPSVCAAIEGSSKLRSLFTKKAGEIAEALLPAAIA